MPKKQPKPDFMDVDKDGNRKESMKKAVKDSKKGKHSPKHKASKMKKGVKKSQAKKSKNKKMNENTIISSFLRYIAEKNYAEANKYLRGLVEQKIKNRIAQSISPNIF